MAKRILQDVVCTLCEHRIGWHGQYTCPGFTVTDWNELRAMLDDWYAENEPEHGFRNDEDVPHFVRVAHAALFNDHGNMP